MIASDLEKNIQTVRMDAKLRGLNQIMVEHVILILLSDNPSVRQLTKIHKPDIVGLSRSLSNYLDMYATTNLHSYSKIHPSPVFERVLKRAAKLVNSGENIDGVHFIAATFSERDSFAAFNLTKYGFAQIHVMGHIADYGKNAADSLSNGATTNQPAALPNLVAMARDKKIDNPVGCDETLATMVKILERKYKNNPILIGEAGVGKTSMVHGLAHRIAAGQVPPSLQDAQIVPILISELVAGTKYRGDFEQRIRQLVDKCQEHGNSIIFIDEIHTLIGNSATASTMDAASIFKPILLEKGIRYIGTTTFAEYRRYIEKDSALSRRFQRLEVCEPRGEALQHILDSVTQQLGEFHQVAFSDECIDAAVEYADTYLPNRYFPDKAIDLLDDCAAQFKINHAASAVNDSDTASDATSTASNDTAAATVATIQASDIAATACQLAGLPVEQETAPAIKNLNELLNEHVVAQEAAARRLTGAVLRGKLRYHHDTKTLGNYLFSGPTGVGKTEMAQQLARLLGLKLLRYDMSEYTSPHTLSRLIGSPPGYVGFEQSGQLVEDVFRHPNAVILFDEAEKAHPEVLNVLLQIMDYGQLSDNIGRAINFKNTILILTSNLGAREMEETPVGFTRGKGDFALWEESINRFFPPEFRNRLDAVIYFAPLSESAISQILARHLQRVQAMLFDKKRIRITLSASLKKHLQAVSFSPTMGARPLARQLRQLVLEPLALAEARGDIAPHHHYQLDYANEQVQIKLRAAFKPPHKPARKKAKAAKAAPPVVEKDSKDSEKTVAKSVAPTAEKIPSVH